MSSMLRLFAACINSGIPTGVARTTTLVTVHPLLPFSSLGFCLARSLAPSSPPLLAGHGAVNNVSSSKFRLALCHGHNTRLNFHETSLFTTRRIYPCVTTETRSPCSPINDRTHCIHIHIYVGRKRVITLADLDGPVSLVIRDRYIESLFMREEEGRGEGKGREGRGREGKKKRGKKGKGRWSRKKGTRTRGLISP